MHQVAMQLVNSKLRKNPGNDNESSTSQLVSIFCIFFSVADDGEPPWFGLVVIFLLFFSLGAADDDELPLLVVIYYI